MNAMNDVKALNRENLGLITVLTGEDVGQYSQLKQALLERIGFDPADLSFSYFDLAETSYQEAEIDLESLPFFEDQKVIILDNVLDLTTTKKSYLDEKEIKRFEAYLSAPLETNRLLILAPGKLDSKRRIVKLLKRDAQLLEAEPLKEAEFKTYFQKEAHDLGLVFDSGVFQDLLYKSNFDFSDMQKNLAFLKSYKGQGLISHEDIEQAIPKTLQDNIFDLTQLVLKGQIDQALDLIGDLRLQGEDEIKLIAVMLGQFRLYLQVAILFRRHLSESQIVQELSDYAGRKLNPYQVKYALRDSRNLSLDFLKAALTILIDCDYRIKRGLYNKDYLFELALLKIVAARKTRHKI